MPTYAELAAEPWWGREYVPASLLALGASLAGHYQVSPRAVGFKGDNRHLRGYHRSREWILNSRYCTNRTYSVTRTPGDRNGGDPRWITGMDASLDRARLIPMCQRLDAAVRSGRLEKVVEWYGNLGGDLIVDGWDNISNRVARSDSSHLDHLHVSVDRGRANEDHSDLLAVLIGRESTMDDSRAAHGAYLQTRALFMLLESFWTYDAESFGHPEGSVPVPNPFATTIKNMARDLHRVAERPQVDPQAVAQALVNDSAAMTMIAHAIGDRIGTLPTAETIARAVLDETHRRTET